MRRNKMPNDNGTGPFGEGPLTGRGMGLCGRGFRLRRVPVFLTESEEKKILESEKVEIEKRLKELRE